MAAPHDDLSLRYPLIEALDEIAQVAGTHRWSDFVELRHRHGLPGLRSGLALRQRYHPTVLDHRGSRLGGGDRQRPRPPASAGLAVVPKEIVDNQLTK